MSIEKVILSRGQLYERIWTTPMRRLAEEFGLSDVGLAKVCKRLTIPRPPVGYWAKKETGKAPPRPPLPADDEHRETGVAFQITVIDPSHSTSNESENASRSKPGTKRRGSRQGRTEISRSLIEAARSQLQLGKIDVGQLTRRNDRSAASIRVSRAQISRATRLFESLITTWQSRGGTVKPSAVGKESGTEFWLDKEFVPVHLFEVTDPNPSARPTARLNRYGRTSPQPTGILGFLTLDLTKGRVRSTWQDGKEALLESMIETIADEVRSHIESNIATRPDRDCESRQMTRLIERQAARRKIESDERGWHKFLLESMQNCQQAEQLRAFAAEHRRRVACNELRITNQAQFDDWLAWANYLANKIDPLMRNGRPPGDPWPANIPIAELDITTRLRAALGALGVKDSDELESLGRHELHEHTAELNDTWHEINRVLEGMGFDRREA